MEQCKNICSSWSVSLASTFIFCSWISTEKIIFKEQSHQPYKFERIPTFCWEKIEESVLLTGNNDCHDQVIFSIEDLILSLHMNFRILPVTNRIFVFLSTIKNVSLLHKIRNEHKISFCFHLFHMALWCFPLT